MMTDERMKEIRAFLGEWAERVEVGQCYTDEIHLNVSKEDIIILSGVLHKKMGYILIQMACNDERELNDCFSLFYTFKDIRNKLIIVLKVLIRETEPEFPSLTPILPAANWYEREIRDMFGLDPKGHPDKRHLAVHKTWPAKHYALRRDFNLKAAVPWVEGETAFNRVDGEGVMQVPVGPIHAGIIEPGHFRFSTVGEKVLNLEAQLFYTHRGMEKISEGKTSRQGLLIAERICGACSFSHSTAYCLAWEKLSGTRVPERALYIRTIGVELERLYNHIGDVGNICAGVGLAFGTMQGARLKEEMQQLNERACGSRFLRGINIPGGVRKDLDTGSREDILITLDKVEIEFKEVTEILLANDSYLDRTQNTGILQKALARDLHAVGPAARSAGVDEDTRRDLPHLVYPKLSFRVPVYQEGDVLARVRIRVEEVFQSIGMIRQALDLMPPGELAAEMNQAPPYSYAIGMTESARGENVHLIMTDGKNRLYRHMVRSASYCNWAVLPSTVPGNIVPDFPLINKSFELCYSCFDR
ncbi:NADH dehydrogenase (ubiquinone) 30 kDa subunit [Syntrophobotulus glycolicus DSM 8271]|uniref:NADH dehydrogenase (Ubiquinone) 30 kDa subunit n=1 Tax=Syntrophobotulus glycolicus (strain DSM 8271 / FlGlyR) TaxID=645991 RepID=F0SVM2_SYNGF|nr:NADH-quinone oxidoreductase subunit C [Syntrophobotulus glycolicus]ADY54498.1 NADH dehydrogenase (ubiquinone) 30 kDa subunit [Syntrophobotulus glycolicus DSM 8271]